MKQLVIFLIICTASFVAIAQNAPTNESDEEAIKKLCIKETDAYVKRDFNTWANCYVDAPTTSLILTNNGDPGSMSESTGFQKIAKGMKEWMVVSPQSEIQVLDRSSWIIKINGNMASVSYSQFNLMVKSGAKIKSKELGVVEKINGAWKISSHSSTWDFKYAVYPNPNPEEEAIKKTIVNETDMWIDGNLEAWSNNFVHEPYLTWSVTDGGNPGDVLTMRGWESLKTFMQKWFEGYNPAFAKEMRKSTFTREKWNIQIRGNVAYVYYSQRSENDKQKLESTQTRMLEKINGSWKIAMQTTLGDFKDATPPIRSKY